MMFCGQYDYQDTCYNSKLSIDVFTLRRSIEFSLLLIPSFILIQNFVGLSISDGYIATGSETNEVCFFEPFLITYFIFICVHLWSFKLFNGFHVSTLFNNSCKRYTFFSQHSSLNVFSIQYHNYTTSQIIYILTIQKK